MEEVEDVEVEALAVAALLVEEVQVGEVEGEFQLKKSSFFIKFGRGSKNALLVGLYSKVVDFDFSHIFVQ